MTTDITFASLALAPALLRAVEETGYDRPTPIQAQAIPLVLKGGDLLAAAQTGTGKTAGFTLPILQRLSANPLAQRKPGRPRCLVLTPTRELAAQIQESVQTYGKYVPLSSMVMFGGVNINPQIAALKKPLDILVCTPGRLLDHAGQRTVDLAGVEILVLDEADRMLDMGFIHDIRRVLALLPKERQTLLFSATFSDDIRKLAHGILRNPEEVSVARRNTASELVEQSVHLVPQSHKRDALSHLIRANDWQQVLVFTRTKHGANRLAEKLVKDGIGAAAIHGNKSQSARTKALAGFKDGSVSVLVATDIAARGLDIDQLPHVVNFELPNVAEDYVHRIGRTGRAGSTGAAVSLVDNEELKLLTGIEKLIKRQIPRLPMPAFALSAAATESDERPPRPQGQRRGAPAGARANAPRQERSPGGQRPGAGRQAQNPQRAAAPQARSDAAAPGGKPRSDGRRATAPGGPRRAALLGK
ncbi:DEAD/DEAH box helicase [Verticiella sediminum]|uniref:ATP-dependent RNA helicase RhlE n=1 Tax=Verticiella sediminum TaxID=1247510 RepID=A0A556A879_9BURK|nr:DEAD/DEAH box helicase [Verticiella sediminum]TSH89085.1 DEAD/DEAH box helicase [Verticiella sediminum]